MAAALPYDLIPERSPSLGLIVLRADETLERDCSRALQADIAPLVTRVESSAAVTSESLAAMEDRLAGAAALFPEGHNFDVIGYGCTSATAQIGAARVARQIRHGACARHVTEPVSATIAACRALDITSLAVISPYVEAVSDQLRRVFAQAGIASPKFASFNEAVEARVARIPPQSIAAAARTHTSGVDAVFLSCTNLRVFDLIAPLEAELGLPILSSNQTLLWHMAALAGCAEASISLPGRLAHARLKM